MLAAIKRLSNHIANKHRKAKIYKSSYEAAQKLHSVEFQHESFDYIYTSILEANLRGLK